MYISIHKLLLYLFSEFTLLNTKYKLSYRLASIISYITLSYISG